MRERPQHLIFHFSFFFGALIFQNLPIFLVFSLLAGFYPRKRRSFGYFLGIAVLALALTFALNPPSEGLEQSLAELFQLGPIPFSLIVGAVSGLTMATLAKSLNSWMAPSQRRSLRR